MVVRVTAGILKEDLAELGIRAEEIGGESARGDGAGPSQPICKVGKGSDIERVEIRDPAIQVGLGISPSAVC